MSEVVANRASVCAHKLLTELQNLDNELSRTAWTVKDCRAQETDDRSYQSMTELLDFIQERREFIKTMQGRLIETAGPAIVELYTRLTRYTEESVNSIASAVKKEKETVTS